MVWKLIGYDDMSMSSKQRITAMCVPAESLAEINHELSLLGFDDLRFLMRSLNCTIEELPTKIAAAKGIKWTQKELSELVTS